MDIGSRLKKFRLHLRMTQSAIGEMVGKSAPTIQRYELGRRNINKAIIFMLEEKLGLNPEWLYTGEGSMFHKSGEEAGRKIEIYESGSSYAEWENGGGITGYYDDPPEFDEPDNFFMLKITGDDMFPLIRSGDLVAVDKTHTECDGAIYACAVGGKILIKKITVERQYAILVDTRTRPLLIPVNDLPVLGKVVRLSRAVGG